MPGYRLYLTDRDGGFLDVSVEEHANDDQALAAAERLLNRAVAIEVWQAARFAGCCRSRRAAPQNEPSALARWLRQPAQDEPRSAAA